MTEKEVKDWIVKVLSPEWDALYAAYAYYHATHTHDAKFPEMLKDKKLWNEFRSKHEYKARNDIMEALRWQHAHPVEKDEDEEEYEYKAPKKKYVVEEEDDETRDEQRRILQEKILEFLERPTRGRYKQLQELMRVYWLRTFVLQLTEDENMVLEKLVRVEDTGLSFFEKLALRDEED